MTAVKQAACSKAMVRRHQTTCRPCRRGLDYGMTHVMAPDERSWRLASAADLHASGRYDGAQPCSDLNISVASSKSTRRRDVCVDVVLGLVPRRAGHSSSLLHRRTITIARQACMFSWKYPSQKD